MSLSLFKSRTPEDTEIQIEVDRYLQISTNTPIDHTDNEQHLLINKGLVLLHRYTNQAVHTYELEMAFLSLFERIATQLKYLTSVKGGHSIICPPPEVENLMMLPSRLIIYRGYREHNKQQGISWSLDRSVAESFAWGATVLGGGGIRIIAKLGGKTFCAREYLSEEAQLLVPTVATGTCELSDVLAYTNVCNEQEILINPAAVVIIGRDNNVSDRVKKEVADGLITMPLPMEKIVAQMTSTIVGRHKTD